MKRRVVVSTILLILLVGSIGGYARRSEAEPLGVETITVPKSWGEFKATSGDELVFEASDGTVRIVEIVRTNPDAGRVVTFGRVRIAITRE